MIKGSRGLGFKGSSFFCKQKNETEYCAGNAGQIHLTPGLLEPVSLAGDQLKNGHKEAKHFILYREKHSSAFS